AGPPPQRRTAAARRHRDVRGQARAPRRRRIRHGDRPAGPAAAQRARRAAPGAGRARAGAALPAEGVHRQRVHLRGGGAGALAAPAARAARAGRVHPARRDSELIHPLTDYVLEAALDQHDRWRDEGMVLPLAVNVATQCLLADTFADRVAAALARHRAEPGHLTLEITESALIADPDRAAAVLAPLRQPGVRLAIDAS